jgi:sec-independent protein translocase protein TatB
MFDLDPGKVLLFGMVALVVVGPKDLPPLLRVLGQFIGRIRKTSDEVKRQFAEVINEVDRDGLQHQLDSLARSSLDIALNPQTAVRGHLPSPPDGQKIAAEQTNVEPATTAYASPEMAAYLSPVPAAPPPATPPPASPTQEAPEVALSPSNADDSRH